MQKDILRRRMHLHCASKRKGKKKKRGKGKKRKTGSWTKLALCLRRPCHIVTKMIISRILRLGHLMVSLPENMPLTTYQIEGGREALPDRSLCFSVSRGDVEGPIPIQDAGPTTSPSNRPGAFERECLWTLPRASKKNQRRQTADGSGAP